MYRKKPFLVTFEGIEGSGKSYQSKKLFRNLKQKKFPVVLTREPGGTKEAEKIRDLILKDYFNKKIQKQFNKYTDTLLYLAARNEHVENKLKPLLNKKKIVICDRFVDSTLAYQVYGKKVEKNLIDNIHKYILRGVKPNITFILKSRISSAMARLNKRKTKNRYDKFSRKFYNQVQKAFIKIAKNSKKRCIVLDNSKDNNKVEKVILAKFVERFKRR